MHVRGPGFNPRHLQAFEALPSSRTELHAHAETCARAFSPRQGPGEIAVAGIAYTRAFHTWALGLRPFPFPELLAFYVANVAAAARLLFLLFFSNGIAHFQSSSQAKPLRGVVTFCGDATARRGRGSGRRAVAHAEESARLPVQVPAHRAVSDALKPALAVRRETGPRTHPQHDLRPCSCVAVSADAFRPPLEKRRITSKR